MTSDRLALVTGATGYVGNHVTEELLREGWSVRTLSRSRDKALTMSWGERIVDEGMQAGPGEVEVFEGDASNFADLNAALKGATAAWYLIHSMGDEQDFRQAENGYGGAVRHSGRGPKGWSHCLPRRPASRGRGTL